MIVQLISDTHGKHREMSINNSADMIVSCGDESNKYNWVENQLEFNSFVDWFCELPIKHKIMIAGNHSAALTKKYNKDMLKDMGIIYLEDSSIEIEGRTIFGSPWSPTFNNWHFMKSREKLGVFWDKLLFEGIDLLITHSPPKGILDTSLGSDRVLRQVGCKGLFKAVMKYKPKHHAYGHIHNQKDIINFGTRILGETQFHNCSAVTDGQFSKPPTNPKGITIKI